jgi:hypothetical protein
MFSAPCKWRCITAVTLAMQIFVEIERARLTRKLAAMKEAEGNITEAADILQEVPVVGDCRGRHKAAHATCLLTWLWHLVLEGAMGSTWHTHPTCAGDVWCNGQD